MICSLCKKETNTIFHVSEQDLCEECFYEECYGIWKGDAHICKICGKLEPATIYDAEVTKALRKGQICSDCWHWLCLIKRANDPRSVRIKHHHYWIGDGVKSPFVRGYKKGLFKSKNPIKIKFHSGKTIETNELWRQGEIPKRFWKDLSDNAEFI